MTRIEQAAYGKGRKDERAALRDVAIATSGRRIETVRDVYIPILFPKDVKGWSVFIPD